MSRTVSNKVWMLPVCLVLAAIISVCCWQRLNAQGVPTKPAPAAAPSFVEQPLTLGTMITTSTKSVKVKIWDGSVLELIRFKYKTLDGRYITVDLPGAYRTEKMNKSAWDTLFANFAMDEELLIDKRDKNPGPMLTDFINSSRSSGSSNLSTMPMSIPALPGITPSSGEQPDYSNPNPTTGAMDRIRGGLPGMGMQTPTLGINP